jgi:hypothetical protein
MPRDFTTIVGDVQQESPYFVPPDLSLSELAERGNPGWPRTLGAIDAR